MENFIVFIDACRIKCDELIQTAVEIKSSPEMTLAWRSLQMAKAWLGKVKGVFNEKNPYYEAQNVASIPETAERYKGVLNISGDKLKDINLMRSEIQELLLSFSGKSTAVLWDKYFIINEFTYAIKHLEEARMWYGFELGNMKEAHKNINK